MVRRLYTYWLVGRGSFVLFWFLEHVVVVRGNKTAPAVWYAAELEIVDVNGRCDKGGYGGHGDMRDWDMVHLFPYSSGKIAVMERYKCCDCWLFDCGIMYDVKHRKEFYSQIGLSWYLTSLSKDWPWIDSSWLINSSMDCTLIQNQRDGYDSR